MRPQGRVDWGAMSLKKTLMKQGMKMMGDPRVQKLMQDERVMKALMQAMSLATEDEVNDLKRTVRRLEDEIARLEREQDKKR